MVFVGSDHYSLRLDIVSDNHTEFSREIFCSIKIFRQLEQGVCRFYALQTVKTVNFYLIAVVAAKHVPAVIKQFHTIRFNGETVTMLLLERAVCNIHYPVLLHRIQDGGQMMTP